MALSTPRTPEHTTTNGWRLGPAHPDYAYSGEYGYPVLETDTRPRRASRRSTWSGGKRGLIVHRRFVLTPEGAAASRMPGAASPEGRPEPAPVAYPDRRAGHSHAACPPSLRWLCRGELPMGWVKASEVAS